MSAGLQVLLNVGLTKAIQESAAALAAFDLLAFRFFALGFLALRCFAAMRAVVSTSIAAAAARGARGSARSRTRHGDRSRNNRSSHHRSRARHGTWGGAWSRTSLSARIAIVVTRVLTLAAHYGGQRHRHQCTEHGNVLQKLKKPGPQVAANAGHPQSIPFHFPGCAG